QRPVPQLSQVCGEILRYQQHAMSGDPATKVRVLPDLFHRGQAVAAPGMHDGHQPDARTRPVLDDGSSIWTEVDHFGFSWRAATRSDSVKWNRQSELL